MKKVYLIPAIVACLISLFFILSNRTVAKWIGYNKFIDVDKPFCMSKLRFTDEINELFVSDIKIDDKLLALKVSDSNKLKKRIGSMTVDWVYSENLCQAHIYPQSTTETFQAIGLINNGSFTPHLDIGLFVMSSSQKSSEKSGYAFNELFQSYVNNIKLVNTKEGYKLELRNTREGSVQIDSINGNRVISSSYTPIEVLITNNNWKVLKANYYVE